MAPLRLRSLFAYQCTPAHSQQQASHGPRLLSSPTATVAADQSTRKWLGKPANLPRLLRHELHASAKATPAWRANRRASGATASEASGTRGVVCRHHEACSARSSPREAQAGAGTVPGSSVRLPGRTARAWASRRKRSRRCCWRASGARGCCSSAICSEPYRCLGRRARSPWCGRRRAACRSPASAQMSCSDLGERDVGPDRTRPCAALHVRCAETVRRGRHAEPPVRAQPRRVRPLRLSGHCASVRLPAACRCVCGEYASLNSLSGAQMKSRTSCIPCLSRVRCVACSDDVGSRPAAWHT